MHTHFGALSAFHAFLTILMGGTLWRLIAAHLAGSDSPTLTAIGSAMAFQY